MPEEMCWDGTLDGMLELQEIDTSVSARAILADELEIPGISTMRLESLIRRAGFQPERKIELPSGSSWEQYSYPTPIQIRSPLHEGETEEKSLVFLLEKVKTKVGRLPADIPVRGFLQINEVDDPGSTRSAYQMADFLEGRKRIIQEIAGTEDNKASPLKLFAKYSLPIMGGVMTAYTTLVLAVNATPIIEFFSGIAVMGTCAEAGRRYTDYLLNRTSESYNNLLDKYGVFPGAQCIPIMRSLKNYFPLEVQPDEPATYMSKRSKPIQHSGRIAPIQTNFKSGLYLVPKNIDPKSQGD